MKLFSKDFENGGKIPKDFTCDGENINPHLGWTDVPEGVESFALIVEDPDAPLITWIHWIVYNIPGEIREIERGSLPEGAKQARNSFGVRKYRGPCPPFGEHRYFFKLYALNVRDIEIKGRRDFYSKVEKHKIDEAFIFGSYRRSRFR